MFKAKLTITNSSRSPVLMAACEGDWSEAASGVLRVSAPSATPRAMQKLLDYLYTHMYENGQEGQAYNDLTPCFILQENLEVYKLANYYQIDDLKKLALLKFRNTSNEVPPPEFAHVILQVT